MDVSPPSSSLENPTSPVRNSIIELWHGLLNNSKLCDVQFQCSDGKCIVAHKCILSAASEYFASYFLGPRAQQHPDNVWVMDNSSEAMWAVLHFIYTGKVTTRIMDDNALELLALGHEYDLTDLVKLVDQSFY